MIQIAIWISAVVVIGGGAVALLYLMDLFTPAGVLRLVPALIIVLAVWSACAVGMVAWLGSDLAASGPPGPFLLLLPAALTWFVFEVFAVGAIPDRFRRWVPPPSQPLSRQRWSKLAARLQRRWPGRLGDDQLRRWFEELELHDGRAVEEAVGSLIASVGREPDCSDISAAAEAVENARVEKARAASGRVSVWAWLAAPLDSQGKPWADDARLDRDRWEDMARGMQERWPDELTQAEAEVYFRTLSDLDTDRVERAVEGILAEDAPSPPPSTEVRVRALGVRRPWMIQIAIWISAVVVIGAAAAAVLY